MTVHMYWITTLLFALVLSTILARENAESKKKKGNDKAFAVMLLYGILFCLQDMFWGLCNSKIIPSDLMLFIASSIFHLSIVLTSYYCMKFFIFYLGDYVKHETLCVDLCIIVLVAQVALVAINVFKPVIFRIENGVYITEFLRPLSFINQYAVYIVSVLMIFICSRRADKKHREKFSTIFWVAIVPLVTGIFQLVYVEAPFYSLGYFVECIIIEYFVIQKERQDASQEMVLNAIANSYYTMHYFNLAEDKMVDYIESEIIGNTVENRDDVQGSLYKALDYSVTEEYVDMLHDFATFDTLSERMKDTNSLSIDFVGKFHGWTRATFIAIEREDDGTLVKVMFTTQIIDAEKKKEQEMFANSTMDQLTGCFNRRAYEMDVSDDLTVNNQNLIYISADVNGLKIVNDTLGHLAGDELLQGAANCMKQCFGPYGKVYRIGGDEFTIIIYANENELSRILEDFDDITANWHGKYIEDGVAVSCGCVSRKEFPDMSIFEMAKLADERMYQNKTEFYKRKGVDRRGQSEAHKALCSLYTKILKINVTDDSFVVVNMDPKEQIKEMGYSEKISEWLSDFGKSGNVHPDDLANYKKQTSVEYIKDYFTHNKTSLIIQYRRKYEDGFKNVIMEMIPASDYASDNQSLFLYVKNIDI
ncbi:MAG: GGDEF domain-containing protein [Saccharofermentans sp.]|nr:GGDEF domain-containing protein [Saccharofermentans sp.]